MLNWFAHCTTTEEIKKEYRRLAYLYHPDRGRRHRDDAGNQRRLRFRDEERYAERAARQE
jgi:curved DNA-binding protein CbpA